MINILSNSFILRLFVCCFFITVTSHVGLAEPTYDLQGDLVPTDSREYTGVIDQLPDPLDEEVSFIISDLTYELAEDVIFRNAEGELTDFEYFTTGMTVGFYAVDYTITKLWPVEETQDEDEDTTLPTETEKGYQKVDGVWVN